MNHPHLSSQFDADLNAISAKMMKMGGLVEKQIQLAMQALMQFDNAIADMVRRQEEEVDLMEVDIDSDCNHLIARRQPTARDLRLIMAITKTIGNLERVGDEAEKIAKRTKRLIGEAMAVNINFTEIKVAGELATKQLNGALSAFTRLDTVSAAQIMKEDSHIDEEFRAFVRKLITYMMEDPRCISVALDFLFIAKAVERIGDHAKNIAEFVIYIVDGTDVRHQAVSQAKKNV